MAERDHDEARRPRPRDRLGRPLPRGAADALCRDGSGREPGTRAEAIDLGVRLFDRQRFFEAHEAFEHAWKSAETVEADRDFWKSVTQVAVGLCHVQRGNPRGARSVLTRAVAGLARYPRVHLGVDAARLAALARAVTAALARPDTTGPISFPPFPRGGRSSRDD